MSTHHSNTDVSPTLPAPSTARVYSRNRATGWAATKVVTAADASSNAAGCDRDVHALPRGSTSRCAHDAADVNDCSTYCTTHGDVTTAPAGPEGAECSMQAIVKLAARGVAHEVTAATVAQPVVSPRVTSCDGAVKSDTSHSTTGEAVFPAASVAVAWTL